MKKAVTKGYLKDKFKDVEITLEDASVPFEIKAEKIPTISQNKSKNLTWKFLKVTWKNFSLILKSIYSNVLTPAAITTKKVVNEGLDKIKESKTQKEILIDSYLTRAELDHYVQEKAQRAVIDKKKAEISQYESEMSNLFSQHNCKISFNRREVNTDFLDEALEHNLAIFEMLAMKLKESRLDTNLHQMKIATTVEKSVLTNRIEFDLKELSFKWSSIFIKAIGVNIFEGIEKSQGHTSSKLVKNVTNEAEKFFYTFSYDINAYVNAYKANKQSVDSQDEASSPRPSKRLINSDITQ